MDAGTLVMTRDCGCIASAIQALIGLMSVHCPNGLYDKGHRVVYDVGVENHETLKLK